MRVLFLAWRDVEHPEAGGSERYVQAIAESLIARGHEVTVRSARPRGLPRRDTINGVAHERAGGRLGVFPRGFLRAMREERSTALVDVINGVPFAAGFLPGRSVVALVHHVHKTQWKLIYPGPKGHLGWFLESWLAPRSARRHRVVTVSEASRRDLVQLGYRDERITVVRNSAPGPCQRDAGPAKDPMRLVVLARLVPHKQVHHALLTVQQLAPGFPALTLDVVGDGWSRSALEAMARDLGIDERVNFHGQVTEAEKERVLDHAALMLMPSAKEGWGLVVTEAGQHAVPSIGYRSSGGLKESIRDGVTGWLVDSLEELVLTTASALRDPAEVSRRGHAAKAYAAELEGSDRVGEFETVLRSEFTGRRR
ncbi:glycosyltransferase family 4 protein [Yimella sp. cx-51]|uniref:glycosyltransferase family 4 protein n=1 Tax=Yimella sp. cx-51 TaxID=2770551 RepID=UPI00165EA93A|nr:glycosyltransferase family 4 protein [Yimella sp. cx-51]QTH39309.1 glycosyltransferase family 4 protein [Yimella sp. cx-51]